MSFELDTFLTATDGIGYSSKREFYQTGYGMCFDQYFWIEIGIEPVVQPPQDTFNGGMASYPQRLAPPVEQVHYVKFYIKNAEGEISTRRWEIKPVTYNILFKLIGTNTILPKFIFKQVEVISNIYHKIKVRLVT